MTEQIVTYEVALLAKEKGFDFYDTGGYYHINEGYSSGYAFCYSDVNEQTEGCLLCPTQSILQKWLRDVHDIHVWCEKQHKDVPNKYGYRLGPDLEHSAFTYNDWSYEEALEEGLVEALNLIKI